MSTLNDLHHYVGGDLSASGTGDIKTAADDERSKQRVLRRLLTNPGSYIWHPDYGAGLGRYIGTVIDAAQMCGLIRAHMRLEESVAQSPMPKVTVTQLQNGIGGFRISIQYVNAATGRPVVLDFNVEK